MWSKSGHRPDSISRDAFLKHLRDCLNHLYDPDHLRHNQLAVLFGVKDQFNASTRLYNILTDAIAALEPPADEPFHSSAWHTYETLFYRYVQQLGQRELADQLGISERHVRRKQTIAMEVLADRLWEQFSLGERQIAELSEIEAPASSSGSLSITEELGWLKQQSATTASDLEVALPIVIDLVRPLAAQQGTTLEFSLTEPLPPLAIRPVAFRQILLDVLSTLITHVAGGTIYLSAKALPGSGAAAVEIEVTGRGQTAMTAPAYEKAIAQLDIARELATLCGGTLSTSLDEGNISARLHLPVVKEVSVLVIDDSADTLQLLQRYVLGTSYRLFTIQDPEEALALAQDVSPQVIILDVMMPETDGWEMLARLRQHPATEDVSIIVCTILGMETLALSLGADAYLRKPFSQQMFLDALDQQTAPD